MKAVLEALGFDFERANFGDLLIFSQLVLLFLKGIVGVPMSWWWVFSPVWAFLAAVVVIAIVVIVRHERHGTKGEGGDGR